MQRGEFTPTRPSLLTTAACLALAVFGVPGSAHASGKVEEPDDHPRYDFEVEPHLVLGWVDPPGEVDGDGYGLGVRGTYEIVDPGFIEGLNNTVGVGVGVDWVNYKSDPCYRDNGSVFCDGEDHQNYLWVPIVLQWNFYLHDQWSVFGEPGTALRLNGPDDGRIDPFVLYLGGRWHFSDAATLTMRVGYPAFSVGVSFLY